MESESTEKTNAELNQKIIKIEKEVQPALYEQSLDTVVIIEESEKILNSKILEITLKIQDQYPELSKFLEEMPVTIPNENNPEITPMNLNDYYNSLTAVLNKYILEHPQNNK